MLPVTRSLQVSQSVNRPGPGNTGSTSPHLLRTRTLLRSGRAPPVRPPGFGHDAGDLTDRFLNERVTESERRSVSVSDSVEWRGKTREEIVCQRGTEQRRRIETDGSIADGRVEDAKTSLKRIKSKLRTRVDSSSTAIGRSDRAATAAIYVTLLNGSPEENGEPERV